MAAIFLQALLPLSILLSVGTFWYALATGGDLELAVLAPAVVVLLVSVLAERYVPYRSAWSRAQGDRSTDLVSTFVLIGLVDPLLKWLGPVAVTVAMAGTSLSGSLGVFPTQWPFAVQVLLATLLAEFGSYWAHRLHHEQRALWWLHALHHGSERLYTLNNFRFHPLNYAINYVFGIVPLLVIGVPEAVFLAYFALTLPVLMLQHANLPLQNGWLNFIFSTNEVHRWHHSSKAGEGDSNFGRALVLWDQVFGTFRYQRGRNDPAAVGLYAASRYPAGDSFLRQVCSMFQPSCCRASV